ncbi:unnamed protein product [Larinioides sclopetarius]|uniref:Major facilitator superfamily associated domain-containing protein n=1 Tax=Larinioides sclopetarius TaxID=280406 RepID=A0AAV2BT67_9ARAC
MSMFAAHAGVLPFITVYAKQMGISADIIGLIMAILCCLTVISRPLIGSIADHLQKLKLVMITLIFIDISADMGLNFIPTLKTDVKQSLFCHKNVSYIFQFDPYSCEDNSSSCDRCILSCDICLDVSSICLKDSFGHSGNSKTGDFLKAPFECFEEAIQNCHKDKNTTACIETENLGNYIKNPIIQLCFLSIFTAIIYICNGSVVSLSDAACFNALGTRPELYGKQRLWGTIGWGSFALLAGYLNQVLTGSSGKYNFSAGFYMLVLLLLTDLVVISKLKLKNVKTSKNIFKDVGMLIVKSRIAIFILQVYFVGIFIGISRSYIFWYLRSLHASQLVLGCSSAVQCFLGELPFFFFAGWIISKIGHVNTFTMSFIANGLKFFIYSFIKNPWLGLLIEFLQGPCFGTFYTAMTSYAKIIAPEGTEATVQGLASGTFEGLALAGVIAFLSVYAQQLGITTDAIGIIFAAVSSLTVVSRPVLGSLADHFGKLKLVLVCLVLMNIVADLGINFIPEPTSATTNSSLICYQNNSYLIQFQDNSCEKKASLCDSNCIVKCYLCESINSTCDDTTFSETILNGDLRSAEFSATRSVKCVEQLLKDCYNTTTEMCRELKDSDDRGKTSENALLQLCTFSILAFIMYICMGSLASLSDAACFSALGEKTEMYGKQRLWGTIGWGAFALLAGYLNQIATGSSTKYNYSAGFYMSVALFVIDLLVIPKLQLADTRTSKNIFRDVTALIIKPKIILFMCLAFFTGLFRGIASYYIFLYLRDLNASQFVLGCASAILCFLGELPFFFLSGWIILKIGHMNTFIVSFAAYGARFLSYSYIKNPWWCLLIEALQGPCHGSLYAAMTGYATIVAPEGTEATVQGLASGVYEGLGVAAGCLLGGYGFKNLGGRETFFWVGVTGFVLAFLNCILNGAEMCHRRSSSEQRLFCKEETSTQE